MMLQKVSKIQGGQKTGCFWDQITLQRLTTERRVIRQKFQNFVFNEMHNLHVSTIKYSLPNLHKSSIWIWQWRMSFVQLSFEIQWNKDDLYHMWLIQTKFNMTTLWLDNHPRPFGSWSVAWFSVSWLSWAQNLLQLISVWNFLTLHHLLQRWPY